jgi:hypothetical protein
LFRAFPDPEVVKVIADTLDGEEVAAAGCVSTTPVSMLAVLMS